MQNDGREDKARAQGKEPTSDKFGQPEGEPLDFAHQYLAKINHEKKIADLKNAGVIYEPVGTTKFALMCMCVPFHGYEIWWLYRQFVKQKERGDKLSPMARVNFPLFYVRKLLEAMRREGTLYGMTGELPVEKIVLYWILLALCMLFPPPFDLFGAFSFAPFIVVNDYLIKLNRIANPDLPLNEKFSPSNYFVLVVGGVYFALKMYFELLVH